MKKNAKIVINDLVGFKCRKIFQCEDYLKFSLDSILLSNFVTIKKSAQKILDIGTGNAPIPLILSTRTKAEIYAIEIQKELFLLAEKTIKINNLEDQVKIINQDIKEYSKISESDVFDIITCNPPYFKLNQESIINKNKIKSAARHEISLTTEGVIKISRKLLKNNGSLVLIHRTERLAEIINLLKKYNLEPKRVRFVYPKKGKNSNLFLIEASKNGKIGLKLEYPLIINEENGNYTKKVLEMMGR